MQGRAQGSCKRSWAPCKQHATALARGHVTLCVGCRMDGFGSSKLWQARRLLLKVACIPAVPWDCKASTLCPHSRPQLISVQLSCIPAVPWDCEASTLRPRLRPHLIRYTSALMHPSGALRTDKQLLLQRQPTRVPDPVEVLFACLL